MHLHVAYSIRIEYNEMLQLDKKAKDDCAVVNRIVLQRLSAQPVPPLLDFDGFGNVIGAPLEREILPYVPQDELEHVPQDDLDDEQPPPHVPAAGVVDNHANLKNRAGSF